jgi:hypothetical protein
MALDQGVTLAEASELSGLTGRQVRYWRDKFRQQGLGIFPGGLSNGPLAVSGSVSAENHQQRESGREAAIVAGQPKAESNQGAKKKNSAALKGADKTAKKAKRVKGKKKRDKKQTGKKNQRKKNKYASESRSGKKAIKAARDKKKSEKKTEKTKKGKKAKAKKK